MTSTVAGDDPEARRVAGELVKLHRDGAIKGADDPEAAFYAQVIHTFGATRLPEGAQEAAVPAADDATPPLERQGAHRSGSASHPRGTQGFPLAGV